MGMTLMWMSFALNWKYLVHVLQLQTKQKEGLQFIQGYSDKQPFLQASVLDSLIILVLPATNAASESFSTMKIIKTYLCSTMKQERLNHLMTLNVYKEQAKELDLITVANDFVRGSEYRMRAFGTF